VLELVIGNKQYSSGSLRARPYLLENEVAFWLKGRSMEGGRDVAAEGTQGFSLGSCCHMVTASDAEQPLAALCRRAEGSAGGERRGAAGLPDGPSEG
jgi:hypothetical protein